MKTQLKFSTKAIHRGQSPDPSTGAVITPLILSSTYVQSSPGQHKGYEYSRAANPTRKALEICLSSLEEGRFGFACASGVAACALVFECLSPGDCLLAEKDLYGGTLRILSKILKPRGIDIHFLDLSQTEQLQDIPSHTKMIWLESPTNPYLKIIDIEKVSQFARKKGILLAVDNTFATPFFQQPLKLGADLVVHSATKYLGGHSDLIGGIVITDTPSLAEKLAFWSKSLGPILSPFDSYLLLRSVKTLAVRMKAHEENAFALTRILSEHKAVKQVFYPGLPSHPQYTIAKKQMLGFSGMFSAHLKGDITKIMRCLKRFQIFTLAESLGGVESLVEHPASMTHASSPHPPASSLIRFSVGLEDKEDLKEDLLYALKEF